MNKDLKKAVSELVAISIESSVCEGGIEKNYSINFKSLNKKPFFSVTEILVDGFVCVSCRSVLESEILDLTIENIEIAIELILGVEK